MPDFAQLDNPLWSTMTTRNADHAFGEGLARRFPSEIAPFASVRESSTQALKDLAQLVQVGESVCLTGILPPLTDAWAQERHAHIIQMVRTPVELSVATGFEYKDLQPADIPDMLHLTQLVYPAYFRAGTPRLGGYVGVFESGQLVAMAGQRMNCDGFSEVSGVCTHPDFQGRKFAQRLSKVLIHRIQSRGDIAFLHVDEGNPRAQSVYERLGFQVRARIPLWVIRRQALS